MNRKEANKIIEKHSAAFGALPREAIEAIEYLINAESCENADDYENEIADLQNRLDIAEYDKERWKEKVTVLEEKMKSLSTEPCEDAISRHDAIRLADELKDDLPDDEQMADIVTAHNEGISEYQTKLSLLPSVIPKQKMGRWLKVDDEEPIAYDCSECGAMVSRRYRFCPDCGAKMVELQEGSEKE